MPRSAPNMLEQIQQNVSPRLGRQASVVLTNFLSAYDLCCSHLHSNETACSQLSTDAVNLQSWQTIWWNTYNLSRTIKNIANPFSNEAPLHILFARSLTYPFLWPLSTRYGTELSLLVSRRIFSLPSTSNLLEKYDHARKFYIWSVLLAIWSEWWHRR